MKFVGNPANIYSQNFPNFKLFSKMLLYFIEFNLLKIFILKNVVNVNVW